LLLAVAGSRLLVLLSAVLLLNGVGLQFHLCLPVSLQNGVFLVVKSIHFLEYLTQLSNVPAVAAIPFVQHDSQVEPSQTAGGTFLKDIPLREEISDQELGQVNGGGSHGGGSYSSVGGGSYGGGYCGGGCGGYGYGFGFWGGSFS